MVDVHVVLFDVSGTLTTVNAWQGITNAPMINRARRRWLIARTLPLYALYKAGIYPEIQFRDRWIRRLASLLRGYSMGEIDDTFAWGVNTYLQQLYRDDVIAELQRYRENDTPVIIVSNIFQGFVDQLVRRLNVTGGIGTRLEYDNGIATGRIAGVPIAGEQKVVYAQQWLTANKYTMSLQEHGAAYADSISDVPLLDAVRFPTATYPDKRLMRVANEKQWRVLS